MLWFRYRGIFLLVACLEMSESCCKGKEALPLAADFSKYSSFPSWWRREEFGGNPCSIHRDIWLSCWGNYQNTQKMGVSIKSTFVSKGQLKKASSGTPRFFLLSHWDLLSLMEHSRLSPWLAIFVYIHSQVTCLWFVVVCEVSCLVCFLFKSFVLGTPCWAWLALCPLLIKYHLPS